MVSGLTPFGTSVAHSACRVGARMLFSSIPGVALAFGSLYPGLPAVALRAREFGSHPLASSHSFPANRRFAEFSSPGEGNASTVVSGLTPFGTSAAHSAYRVGARIFFSFIPGVLLAYGSRHPGLPAAALICSGLENSARIRSQASVTSSPRTAGSPNSLSPFMGRNNIGRG